MCKINATTTFTCSEWINKDLKKQLSQITDDVMGASGNKQLSDDLTIIGIGKRI